MKLGSYGPYGLVLYIHSIIRWLVLAAGAYALMRTWRGRLGGRPWEKADGLVARVFVSVMDLQLLVGIILYGIFSPAVAGGFMQPEIAVPSRGLRFWMIEHPLAAVVAVALAHVGYLKAKKGGANAHRDASLFFTLAVVIVLAALPWPIFSYGRALWPTW